jgi:phospholipase C
MQALPYELHMRGTADFIDGVVNLHFGNTGKVAAVYQVYAGDGQTGPWTYTIAPHTELSASWSLSANGQTEYNLSVFGPNGFLRVFKGSISGNEKANLVTGIIYEVDGDGVILGIANNGKSIEVSIVDSYSGRMTSHRLKQNGEVSEFFALHNSYGWYDFTVTTRSDPDFERRLAGHVETGRDIMTDPAIGTP